MKSVWAVTVVLALAACHGNPLNNGTTPPTSATPPSTDTTPSASGAISVPATLANNMVSAVYDPGSDTMTVKMGALDAPNVEGTYVRNAALDVPGFKAYTSQQSSLDRLFIALTAASADGSVNATVAGDGGQFNIYYSGTTFDRPGVATATMPTSGEAKFTGSYAGLTNMAAAGTNLKTPPAGADPSTLPREALRTQGDVYLIANFADLKVNGSIYNRKFADGSGNLHSLALTPGDMDTNGQFNGKVQYTDRLDLGNQGDYGGIISKDQGAAAGSIRMNSVYPSDDPNYASTQRETGVFVLTNCTNPAVSGSAVCTGSAP